MTSGFIEYFEKNFEKRYLPNNFLILFKFGLANSILCKITRRAASLLKTKDCISSINDFDINFQENFLTA